MNNKLKTVDAETLLSTPISKTMFIVDGLISQGVNVISGASKIGKSWLMLWLGLQVAQGNSIWGLSTLQCDVLYLSLEDTQRRIKGRLYNLTDSAPDNLYFAVTSGLIGGGLEEQITDFLTEHGATANYLYGDLQNALVMGTSGVTKTLYGRAKSAVSSLTMTVYAPGATTPYCTFTRFNATVVSGNVLFNQVGEWEVVVSGTGLRSYTYLIRVV